MVVDNNACISQINAIKGVIKARHYVVMLRGIQESVQLGIMHTQRIDTKDNIADMFTKPLPVLPFWRLSTSAMGDEHTEKGYAEIGRKAILQDINGGSVKALNREVRASLEQQKADAKNRQAKRREEEAQNRQLQTATMAMALDLANRILERAGGGAGLGIPRESEQSPT